MLDGNAADAGAKKRGGNRTAYGPVFPEHRYDRLCVHVHVKREKKKRSTRENGEQDWRKFDWC